MARRKSLATKTLSPKQYQRLRSDLDKLLAQGRNRVELALGRELLRTYHAVGCRLLDAQLSGRAGYGTATVERLADDVGVKPRVLQHAMALARAFPEGPPEDALSWSHYRHLLPLSDSAQRDWYEREARRRGWSTRQLAAAIREGRHREGPVRQGQDASSRHGKQALRRPSEATYVYAAQVERVVDGDTLLVVVDLGFDVLRRQRLRLAGLDTPEIDTPEGIAARQFVQDELARVDEIMLKTNKIDLYGRYVAHVFYEPGESSKARIFAKGRYLNQLLVDQGLATPL